MSTDIRRGWRKSTFSNNGGASCVEVNFVGNQVLVRDSKYLRDSANDPATQPVLSMSATLWPSFCTHSMNPTSESDATGLPRIVRHADGHVSVTNDDASVELVFTPDEWTAFIEGVRAGEFDLLTV
ncbi:DUF397 domain-containing protein [Nocardia sp. NPDC004068]|uniref:DUF397 domain-containing protein n=1 Tax=Nocardia sp. NPDC004068 TaxID=3364303 RepID=UPI0036AB235E